MSKAWGGASAGAWALDAERAEEEERQRAAIEGSSPSDGTNSKSFPSLKEAATAKSKKKKPVTVPLAEFNAWSQVGRGASAGRAVDSKGLTPDEMIRLPTGPRERSAEELEASRFGGGFRSYGYGTGGVRSGGFGGGRRGEDGVGGRRFYGGGGGGFDDDSRIAPRNSDFDQPSREEAVDHWATGKKSIALTMDSGRQDRYGTLGGGGSSRADEVDSWSSLKKALPVRQQSYSSGYRTSTNLTNSDRWVREGQLEPVPVGGERERRKLVLDPPKSASGAQDVAPSRSRPSPFGDARPREEVLAEKGLDWKKLESEIEIKKSGGPSSAHSSRPSSAQSSRPGSPGSLGAGSSASAVEGLQKPRRKINPFGDAKPREILLQEQGKDWKKIDLELEHGRVKRPETVQERQLKEEIDLLKKLLSTEAPENTAVESTEASAEDHQMLVEQLRKKENALEVLVQELDDKVRYSQRSSEITRPGSGAGRPPSQSGRSDGPQAADAFAEPYDKRRGFRVGSERSIIDNRNMERSTSRERW